MKSTGSISPPKSYYKVLNTLKFKIPWVGWRDTHTLYHHVRFDAHKKSYLVD